MSASTSSRATFSCEACDTPLLKRTSRLQHRHLRSDVWVCQNPLCGATYTGNSELTSIASPSGMPDAPASELPPTPGYTRALLQMQWKLEHGSRQLDMLDAIEFVEASRIDAGGEALPHQAAP
ncbi:hypothetical protein I5U65_00570 [Stenotrophomonas maltophilia]|nr:hypothetical protein [Stenotrophomonas maltophilia]